MRLIAVVLGTPAGQTRFDEARAMLEYGFANVQLVTPIAQGQALDMTVPVRLGGRDEVSVLSGGTCSLLERRGEKNALSLEAALVEKVNAPVYAGDVLGEIRVKRGDEVVAVVPRRCRGRCAAAGACRCADSHSRPLYAHWGLTFEERRAILKNTGRTIGTLSQTLAGK